MLNVHTLKPLDRAAVERAARETGRLVTVEEHFVDGGLGGAVAEILAELGAAACAASACATASAPRSRPYPELLRIHGIDAAGVEAAVKELIETT